MTLQRLLFLMLLQSVFLQILYGQQSKRFFREDYRYLADTESFYKIHTIHRTWQDAKKRCALEGANLFYPEDRKEADAVIEFWNQTQPFRFVYIGVSNLLAKEVFQTHDDGRSILDVYNNWAPGEPNDANGEEGCVILRRDYLLNDERCDKKFPFICKKTLLSLEWNEHCDKPGRDYAFDSVQGRCYKLHLVPKTWSEALTVCDAEQSYLAFLNSQSEADHLVKMTEQAPKGGGNMCEAVYLGFHNKDGEGWKTIKGTSVSNSGYSKWVDLRPDGGAGDTQQCGAMLYNEQLNNLDCLNKCPFICKHDISSLANSYDERFGD